CAPGASSAAGFDDGYADRVSRRLEMVRALLDPVLGTSGSARHFDRCFSAIEPRDLLAAEPALARLTVPTLVVWGTGDEFFDVRWAYWLRDTIPGVTELVEIEGGKLFFPDERAAELVPHLRRHWLPAGHHLPATGT